MRNGFVEGVLTSDRLRKAKLVRTTRSPASGMAWSTAVGKGVIQREAGDDETVIETIDANMLSSTPKSVMEPPFYTSPEQPLLKARAALRETTTPKRPSENDENQSTINQSLLVFNHFLYVPALIT